MGNREKYVKRGKIKDEQKKRGSADGRRMNPMVGEGFKYENKTFGVPKNKRRGK